MSFNASVVAVKSTDHFDLESVIRPYGYSATSSVEVVFTFDEAVEKAYVAQRTKNESFLIVSRCGEWTILFNMDNTMPTDQQACEAVAKHLERPLFSMMCGGRVGIYYFSYFDPAPVREVWFDHSDGFIRNNGKRMVEEDGLHTTKRVNEEDIMRLMARLGFDWKSVVGQERYEVHRLELVPAANEPFTQPQPQPASKPWWKIW